MWCAKYSLVAVDADEIFQSASETCFNMSFHLGQVDQQIGVKNAFRHKKDA